MESYAPLISAIAALMTTIFGFVGAYWLHKRQSNIANADTAGKWQQIADRAAESIDRLQQDVSDLKKENEKLMQKLECLADELEDWKDKVERLVHQLKSLGYEPVVSAEKEE